MGFSKIKEFLNGHSKATAQSSTPTPIQPRILVTSGCKLADSPPRGRVTTPVRDMTESEARDQAKTYWDQHEFEFTAQTQKGWSFPLVSPMTRDKEGKLHWGGQLMLKNEINGVKFVNVSVANAAPLIYGCGWRMLVLACRMSKFILSEFGGPATIYHLGFAGRGDIDSNRHNRGTAFDLAGAITGVGEFTVTNDWSKMPVPDSLGGKDGKWPSNLSFTNPRFRLTEGDLGKPYARDFFLKMYNFAIRECRDGGTKDPTNTTGLHHPSANGFVVHPDYGTDGGHEGRGAHFDHMHMDVADEIT
jgi:hypothetical protein